jgi:hypothetical protein
VLLDLVFKCEMIVRSGGRGPLNGMLHHCVYSDPVDDKIMLCVGSIIFNDCLLRAALPLVGGASDRRLAN